MKRFSVRQVAEAIGADYEQVRYACLAGVVHPVKVDKARLLTERDIDTLKRHFDARRERRERQEVTA